MIDFSYLFLLFPAAAAPAPATPSGKKASSKATPKIEPLPAQANPHGSEGRKSIKIQNCAQKLPNVTSETHRKR